MREVIDFCIYILQSLVNTLFGLDLGGYSFGEFLVAVFVVSVFVSCLVVSFKRGGGSPSSFTRPSHPHRRGGSGSGGGSDGE